MNMGKPLEQAVDRMLAMENGDLLTLVKKAPFEELRRPFSGTIYSVTIPLTTGSLKFVDHVYDVAHFPEEQYEAILRDSQNNALEHVYGREHSPVGSLYNRMRNISREHQRQVHAKKEAKTLVARKMDRDRTYSALAGLS